jgi:hypothetical protein
MSNCAQCNKVFTCGCQKVYIEGKVICKACAANQKSTPPKDTSRDLALELAKQQIQDLRNK